MSHRAFKIRVFVLEGLNALSLAFYFLFLFFYMQLEHGFGNMENLMLGGYGGFVYMVASFSFGRWGRQIGFLRCLRIAFATVTLTLVIGSQVTGTLGQMIVFTFAAFSMGFIWAPLQALCCAGESPDRVQSIVGIYNTIWASLVALGYFVGGALYEAWPKGIFLVPAIIAAVQLLLAAGMRMDSIKKTEPTPPSSVEEERAVPTVVARAFLKMCWIANPFAFVAANVCTPTIPTLAEKFGLTPTMAGVFCSVWLFARAAGFVLFWNWKGWHYRMRWLVLAFLGTIAGFAGILMSPTLVLVLLAQLLFGLALGLIYYSSLYYSMHVDTDSQGEHGGIHEAVIGAGNCIGPLIGAGAILAFPRVEHAAAITVSLALGFGFIWICRVWVKRGARTA
jgi:MFS family permease